MIALVPNIRNITPLNRGSDVIFNGKKTTQNPEGPCVENYLYMDINQNNTRHPDVCYLIGVNGTTQNIEVINNPSANLLFLHIIVTHM